MENVTLNETELAYEMESSFKDLLCAEVKREENVLTLTFADGKQFKVTFTKA